MNYILSIGINDYRNCSGGTNKVVMAHQELFKMKGYGYIYISPIHYGKKGYWEIILDNLYISVRSTSNLLYYLYNICIKGNSICEIHIHHLTNVSLSEVDKILSYLKCNIKFYIHDYYTICPSIKMLRNDAEFCGCQKMSDNKCNKCNYYEAGKGKIPLIENLLKEYQDRIIFIAPSDSAKEQWLEAYAEYKNNVEVVYHQKLQGKYKENKVPVTKSIKVGYLGEQTFAKGWDVWKSLIDNVYDDRYKFYYFGKSKDKKIENVKVDFRKDINAMVKALRKKQLDCVVLWSVWKETYSYTYYESLAANTFVITNKFSGNIADQVEKRGNGIVLNNEEELICLFRDFDSLKDIINQYKKSNNYGPRHLVENPDIITYITSNNAIIEKIDKPKLTYKEMFFSAIYRVLQPLYYIKRKMP